MNLKDAFQKIESDEFAAYLGAASDLSTFLRAAKQQEVVHCLKKALNVPEALHEVFFRIYDLSRETVDLRYENR
jgi:hypothetical protein